jgi:O-acetyl-ADP-ribose deacetylase (regulator of RNase III)
VWHGGAHGEDELLASAYRRSLEVAAENGARTVAFPSISTGVYGFPVERAAPIALREIARFLRENEAVEKVYMVTHGDDTYEVYRRALEEMPV